MAIPVNRSTLFAFLQEHPKLSNLPLALARLPPPSNYPKDGWSRIKLDYLQISSAGKPGHERASSALEQADVPAALLSLKAALGLRSITIGDSLQWNSQEKLLCVSPAGALALAVAQQHFPAEISNAAPCLKAIISESPLPAATSAEQIGQALFLLQLAAHGPETAFSLSGFKAAGYQWMATRTQVPAQDILESLQELQLQYAKALY